MREHYAEIGGGSPIRRLTEQQAKALEAALRAHISARTIVAMRYWHPNTEEAIAALESAPFDELVLLPLYPHYSFATTGSSLKEWNRLYKPSVPVQRDRSFLRSSGLHCRNRRAHQRRARPAPESRRSAPWFSARTGCRWRWWKRAILIRSTSKPPCGWFASWALGKIRTCSVIQSKVGPQKWLQPSLTGTIEKMARDGIKRMLVIPISFLTEHIETLHEINIEAREHAESLGVTDFHMMPALNDSPLLIRALADLVLRSVGMRAGVASVAS